MRKTLLACTGLTLALMAATAVNAQSGGSGGSSGSSGTGAAGATSQGSGSQAPAQAPGTQSGSTPRGGSPGETRAQTPGGGTGAEPGRPGRADVSPNAAPNAGSPRTQSGPAGENPANRNAEGQRDRTDQNRPQDAQRNQPNDPSRTAQDRREPTDQRAGGNRGNDTTGSVNLTAEKRTTIHQSITREHVTPVRDVNFQVNVGVEVPRTVDLRPLPPSVIEVVPQYRGYRFFVLGDGRIVIVQPSDYKIVTIISS